MLLFSLVSLLYSGDAFFHVNFPTNPSFLLSLSRGRNREALKCNRCTSKTNRRLSFFGCRLGSVALSKIPKFRPQQVVSNRDGKPTCRMPTWLKKTMRQNPYRWGTAFLSSCYSAGVSRCA